MLGANGLLRAHDIAEPDCARRAPCAYVGQHAVGRLRDVADGDGDGGRPVLNGGAAGNKVSQRASAPLPSSTRARARAVTGELMLLESGIQLGKAVRAPATSMP